MLNQVIFNLVIFLMGYIFLFTLSSIGRHYRCVISYVIGLALWGIVSTLIIISLTLVSVDSFFINNQLIKDQIDKTQKIIKDFKTNKSSEIAASVLSSSL